MGQGDFFLPADVVSGNYKIIAYTQWMKNGIDQHYFQSNIVIINPMQKLILVTQLMLKRVLLILLKIIIS